MQFVMHPRIFTHIQTYELKFYSNFLWLKNLKASITDTVASVMKYPHRKMLYQSILKLICMCYIHTPLFRDRICFCFSLFSLTLWLRKLSIPEEVKVKFEQTNDLIIFAPRPFMRRGDLFYYQKVEISCFVLLICSGHFSFFLSYVFNLFFLYLYFYLSHVSPVKEGFQMLGVYVIFHHLWESESLM